jgi:integrase
MPTVAKGEVRYSGGTWRTRVTLKGKNRLDVPFTQLVDPEQRPEAERASQFVTTQAGKLRRAGKIETLAARELLLALGAEEELGPEAEAVVDRLCGTKGDPLAARGGGVTFAQLSKRWTEGELASAYPDHVREKNSELDESRLKYLCGLDVGGVKLGDVGLQRFTLRHAQSAMSQLPKAAKTAATRRHYAQLLSRVLALAVWPCEIIKASPLPRGFLPKVGKPPVHPYLYPAEDRALLRHAATPLEWRMLWGVLAREGVRLSEALGLRVGHELDLERGLINLDENKTDDPRSWTLDPGVRAALGAWVKARKAKRGDLVFPVAAATARYKFAALFRTHLAAAGVDRPALFESGTNREPIRAHDLRGTFVTLSLANGKSETWVADRTGHKSSVMINRYRRAARTAAELNLGALDPLDRAIPNLRRGPSPTASPTKVKKKTSKK